MMLLQPFIIPFPFCQDIFYEITCKIDRKKYKRKNKMRHCLFGTCIFLFFFLFYIRVCISFTIWKGLHLVFVEPCIGRQMSVPFALKVYNCSNSQDFCFKKKKIPYRMFSFNAATSLILCVYDNLEIRLFRNANDVK